MKIPFKQYFHIQISDRALRVALIVGTILNFINHYDLLLGHQFTTKELIQIVLTYVVPYFVSTHGQLISLTNNTKGRY